MTIVFGKPFLYINLQYDYKHDPFNYEYFPPRLDYVYNNNPYNIMSVCIQYTSRPASPNRIYNIRPLLDVTCFKVGIRSIGTWCGRYRTVGGKGAKVGEETLWKIYYYNNSRMFKKNSRGISVYIIILYYILIRMSISRNRRLRTNWLFNVICLCTTKTDCKKTIIVYHQNRSLRGGRRSDLGQRPTAATVVKNYGFPPRENTHFYR